MSDLLKLAERCEREDASSNSQEACILAAFDAMFPEPDSDYQPKRQPSSFSPEWNVWVARRSRVLNLCQREAFIDAAASMVPGKDLWCVGDDSEGPFARITPGLSNGGYSGSEQITAFAARPALALCAAALRARAI